jgi:hypothetical protein
VSTSSRAGARKGTPRCPTAVPRHPLCQSPREVGPPTAEQRPRPAPRPRRRPRHRSPKSVEAASTSHRWAPLQIGRRYAVLGTLPVLQAVRSLKHLRFPVYHVAATGPVARRGRPGPRKAGRWPAVASRGGNPLPLDIVRAGASCELGRVVVQYRWLGQLPDHAGRAAIPGGRMRSAGPGSGPGTKKEGIGARLSAENRCA